MKRGMRVGLVPVLGGFALALGIVALVVGEAAAQTVCERCKSIAWNRANSDPKLCAKIFGQERLGCLNNYVYDQCVKNGPCPDANPAPTTVTCTYMEPNVGALCTNGANNICDNATWGIYCDVTDPANPKKCQDINLAAPSPCSVQCGCK